MSETPSITMSVQDVMKYLPHRYPFLLIDKVIECRHGEAIVAIKNVTINEGFCQGHFPQTPVFPGVLILEAMAQVSGVLAFETRGTRPSSGINYLFGGVEKARFRRPVIPGDRLNMKSAIIADRGWIMKFDCTAYVEDAVACSAILTIVEQRNDK